METVKLQCGNCNQLMAIGVEHLGGQVQCPHCKTIVRTVAPEKPAPGPAPDPDATQPHDAAIPRAPLDSTIRGDLPPTPASVAPFEEEEEAPLPKFKPRPVYDRSLVPIIGLIFLVPYAFFATLFIIYLLFLSPKSGDPLENLRDPAPNPAKGGAKRTVERPKHDQPLAARWHTPLGKPIQAGDLLLTPQRVRLDTDGDLQLILRAKNTSTNSAFEPIHVNFSRLDFNENADKPYSFLESRSKTIANLYGMDTIFYQDLDARKPWTGNTSLKPGEEMTISMTTYDRYRGKQVADILKSGEEYTWRVHVRKGFVRVDNKDVSATMVIGVDFSSAQIEGKKG